MNENLTWHFDLSVVEWLIVLIMLVVLSLVGAVVTHRTLKAVKGVAGQSGKLADDSNPWHALESARVFTRLDAGPDGLAKDEVNLRLGKYGPNRLPEASTRGPLVRFFYQFHNVLIYVLLAASGVTAMLGHWVDAGVILGVVVVNAVIGFVQVIFPPSHLCQICANWNQILWHARAPHLPCNQEVMIFVHG